MTNDDSERTTTMTKTNWESDDAYRARLIAERARLGLPSQMRVVKYLTEATGFDLDLWGRDLGTPRLGVSAGHAAAVLAWDSSTNVRPQHETAARDTFVASPEYAAAAAAFLARQSPPLGAEECHDAGFELASIQGAMWTLRIKCEAGAVEVFITDKQRVGLTAMLTAAVHPDLVGVAR